MANIKLLKFDNFFYSNYLNFKKEFFLCPFHKENTPSFLFNKNEGYFYCFSCKKYLNKYNLNILKYKFLNNINFNKNSKKKYIINKNKNNYILIKKKIINLNNFLKNNFFF